MNRIDKRLLDINNMDNIDKFEVEVFENGEALYKQLEGRGGYSGVMVRSPHYLGLIIKEESRSTLIKASYTFESIITELRELGLGTCWISLNQVNDSLKKEIIEGRSGSLKYLLAFGYPEEKPLLAKDAISSRLSIEDLVYFREWGNKVTIEELEARGLKDLFYYVRFAPSNLNSQPWRFVLEDDRVLLYLEDIEQKENIIDGGIVMYYFEKMAHGMGINGTWEISKASKNENINNYSFVGVFSL